MRERLLTITEAAEQLSAGETTSRNLVETCLARAADDIGEGARVYLTTYADRARADADHVEQMRANGWAVPTFAGVPISIKDLFDVAGEVTRAGSKVFDADQPAIDDAPAIQRLRAAGFIIIGKTNMTEFAYSGLGMNAHFGTPLSPYDRATGRIPGGSSSGGAVSVADGMAIATIGTDTGGSCRIPAAFCGIVGFKPTSTRVPKEGAVPLSKTMDSIGPLANSVSCCALLDSVLVGNGGENVTKRANDTIRIGVIDNYVTNGMETAVGVAIDAALSRLSAAGVGVDHLTIPELEDLPHINRMGGIVGAEAYAFHKPYAETRANLYDPWVFSRFDAGKAQSAADFIEVIETRAQVRVAVANRVQGFDALALPTVAITPPALADLADPDVSNAINQMTLRNTAVGNFLDWPSISIPCHAPDAAPVGFMLMGHTDADRALISVATGLENLIRGR